MGGHVSQDRSEVKRGTQCSGAKGLLRARKLTEEMTIVMSEVARVVTLSRNISDHLHRFSCILREVHTSRLRFADQNHHTEKKGTCRSLSGSAGTCGNR